MQQTKFKALPSYGSYFQLYSYSDITDESEGFAIRLTKEYGVATIPHLLFIKTAKIIKCCAFVSLKKESTLEEAANRLIKVSGH